MTACRPFVFKQVFAAQLLLLLLTWYLTVASSRSRLIPAANDCLIQFSQAAASFPHSSCQKSHEACCERRCNLLNASKPLGSRISLMAFAAPVTGCTCLPQRGAKARKAVLTLLADAATSRRSVASPMYAAHTAGSSKLGKMWWTEQHVV